jgi:hypothetical protein
VPVLSLIWRVRSVICRIPGRALFSGALCRATGTADADENAMALGFAGNRLIASLCGWLAAR